MADVPPPPPPGPSQPVPPAVPVPPPFPLGYGGGGEQVRRRANGFAITSLVLGVVGLVVCLLPVFSVLAIVFGALSLGQFKNRPDVYSGRGMAVAGLVLGIVALVLFIVLLVAGSVDYNLDTSLR